MEGLEKLVPESSLDEQLLSLVILQGTVGSHLEDGQKVAKLILVGRAYHCAGDQLNPTPVSASAGRGIWLSV